MRAHANLRVFALEHILLVDYVISAICPTTAKHALTVADGDGIND